MNVARIAVLAAASLTLLTVATETASARSYRHHHYQHVVRASNVAQGLGYGLHVMLRSMGRDTDGGSVMRAVIALLLLTCGLSACADYEQAAPVDPVTQGDLP